MNRNHKTIIIYSNLKFSNANNMNNYSNILILPNYNEIAFFPNWLKVKGFDFL